jgi:elongation factor P--(R)-beta-lysine ligase
MKVAAAWQPTCDMVTLRQRAHLIQRIRQFFQERQVLEVQTPSMSYTGVTDEHLSSFVSDWQWGSRTKKLYLQTSPEFYMKRLLCAGSGCIYQLNSAFRNEESGRYHQPEFQMLEWYRIGFDMNALIEEVGALLMQVLECRAIQIITYQAIFQEVLHCDPLSASLVELKQLANSHGFADVAACEDDRDTLLQFLFSCCIEPNLGHEAPLAVCHFPASQAALAKISRHNPLVAQRFEVYIRGVELANGFEELTCADEQRSRFEADNKKRAQQQRPQVPLDHIFLAALEAGLPSCAGVALGVDRLLMLALKQDHIRDVNAFALSMDD